ncbi:hypothetical protein N7510_002070 [Penicillium lagena]|uniref:uncharacterized protein n=1 Tax=Penicillium lagena TaxID=94218 RepID=UPI002541391E|nr:uncharacterized protein N7510_002070 [Penicillium lagena]KAJ5625761.1 hypothetical protein N7510_002070 [Penicillium lagena]
MVTENGNPRFPPPATSDLRGRRRIPHPPRLDSLKIDPCASRPARSVPRSTPSSPRARSPPPPAPHSAFDDRRGGPFPPQGPSPGTRDDWKAGRGRSPARSAPYSTTPDAQPPRWFPPREDSFRKAPLPRGGLRICMSAPRLNDREHKGCDSPDYPPQDIGPYGLPLPRFPSGGPAAEDGPRSSFNSAVTSRSSIEQASGTERSSVLTKSSSITDLSPDTPDAPYGTDEGMSVEDAISMYLDGFSDVTEEPSSPKSHVESKAPSLSPPPSRDSLPEAEYLPELTSLDDVQPIPPLPEPIEPIHIVQEPAAPDPIVTDPPASEPTLSEPAVEPVVQEQTVPLSNSEPPLSESPTTHQRQASRKVFIPGPVPPPLLPESATRDSHGFRKATQYVTLEQYESWKGPYSEYVTQRRLKWQSLFEDHGLPTVDPSNFPPASTKVKRLVRKGIPSELRGAAWFWYAGGYDHMNRNPWLYDQLVRRAMESPNNDDKEHIERDLHRTFPDNLHFKPETVNPAENSGSSNPQYDTVKTETQMILSLRRVLYAFSLHNPKIGYTQSLNFITGMLLLFLPEEKAFWMLHIITSVYLPGTHEISLEGANIDLWVLMSLLRDSTPNIYSKIASMSGHTSSRSRPPALTVHSRLPDITLGLTNWLMSVFIGTLPLETTLRVWDIFFYEGSKTFFRVSLALFKACERDILAVSDPMEVFQVVQTVPKKLLDANALLEDCFLRRHRVGQGRIEELRASRRTAVRQEKLRRSVAFSKGQIKPATDDFPTRMRTPIPGQHRVADSWRQLKQRVPKGGQR